MRWGRSATWKTTFGQIYKINSKLTSIFARCFTEPEQLGRDCLKEQATNKSLLVCPSVICLYERESYSHLKPFMP